MQKKKNIEVIKVTDTCLLESQFTYWYNLIENIQSFDYSYLPYNLKYNFILNKSTPVLFGAEVTGILMDIKYNDTNFFNNNGCIVLYWPNIIKMSSSVCLKNVFIL